MRRYIWRSAFIHIPLTLELPQLNCLSHIASCSLRLSSGRLVRWSHFYRRSPHAKDVHPTPRPDRRSIGINSSCMTFEGIAYRAMFGFPIATTLSAFLLACAARQVVLSPPQVPDTACRCLHGDPCWPSQEAFAAFAARLSRPLVRPLPTAHPCYAAPDGSDCLEARGNWKNGTWRADRPGAAQHPNFEAFVSTATGEARGCYFNTTLGLPCEQGSVPVIGVDARTVEDVQLAVEFAVRHNLKLVVKNTG